MNCNSFTTLRTNIISVANININMIRCAVRIIIVKKKVAGQKTAQ